MGIKNRTFRLYKLKINKKEENSGADPIFFHQPENPWSKFIRDSGLEILPSLINVIKGEMSLVGPEPHTQKDFQKFSSEIPLYPNRLLVKPGLLNLANLQSKPSDILYGKNSSNPFAQRLEYDLRYAENLSLFLDLKVLLGSIFLPLARRRNA